MKEFEKFTDEIKKAIVIREVENSFLTLFGQGKLNGTVHTCIGQEFTGVFVSKSAISAFKMYRFPFKSKPEYSTSVKWLVFGSDSGSIFSTAISLSFLVR